MMDGTVPSASAARCVRALRKLGVPSGREVHTFFVPGRIEVLGKHTDYAGGRSLLCGLERGFCMVAAGRQDATVVMMDAQSGERIEFVLTADPGTAIRGWANYPYTVARRVARNFGAPLRGADIAFASDLPQASGMSSSSAFVVATFLALSAVNDFAVSEPYRNNIHSPEDLADYLSAVENGRDYGGLVGDRGVGTRGGSEDHTAILCARRGELVQYAFDPVRFERSVSVPEGYVFAIGCSGVQANKGGAAMTRYNRLSDQVRTMAELWQAKTGRSDSTIGAALDSGPDAEARMREIVQASGRSHMERRELTDRLDQFIAESREIIPSASDALERRELDRFGTLVDRSQSLAERVLGNQIDETVHLARSARGWGAAAASAFGAGFGGSVWALVEESGAEDFLEAWREQYLDRFPRHAGSASFFLTHAGAPARRLQTRT